MDAAYASPDELIAIFGEREMITLSTHGAGEQVDTEELELAICYASSEVNSYLASRYKVPLEPPVPRAVMLAVGDIVRYRLTSGDVSEKDPIVERYKLAIRWLRDVASGLVAIPCQGAGMPPGTGGLAICAGQRDWGHAGTD